MDFFQGGMTAYNIGQKTKHLSVDPVHALTVNCVSARVTAQMALAVPGLFLSDWGIACTGYASPVPELNITRLFAYHAVSLHGEILLEEELDAVTDEPARVQIHYVNAVLKGFAGLLAEQPEK
jgi:nicotinamide mononucleotide (NMN) deamidase PncC